MNKNLKYTQILGFLKSLIVVVLHTLSTKFQFLAYIIWFLTVDTMYSGVLKLFIGCSNYFNKN